MSLLYFLVALFCSSCTLAIPIPDPLASVAPGPSPIALVLGLCTPCLVLAIAKYAYMKYRRAECIHSEAAEAEAEAEAQSSPRLVGLGLDPKLLKKGSRKLKLNFWSGYAVGMLGSPEWETRVKIRVDQAVRKAHPRCPSEAASRAVSPSTVSRSRFDSSYRSRDTNIGEYGSSRYPGFSTSSKSRTMSLSFLEMYSPDSNVMGSSAAHSASMYYSDTPPQLPPTSELAQFKVNSSRSRKQVAPSSPSLTFTQMIEPVMASWQDDSLKQEMSRSTGSNGRSESHSLNLSPTPPFETPPSTPAKSSTSRLDAISRISRTTTDDSGELTSAVLQVAQLSPLSFDTLTIPSSNKPPATEKPKQTSPSVNTPPLSAITRPLNIGHLSAKPNTAYISVSPAKYLAERSVAPRTKSQRRRSGSPSIGPSPLRNPVSSISSPSVSNVMEVRSTVKTEGTAGSSIASSEPPIWELNDLMKNGQLDIDAVTEALGLGFSLNSSSGSDYEAGSCIQSPAHTVSFSNSLLRKPGGPLCAIPEETDTDDSITDANVRPLSSLIERWGRVQHYQRQKFSVDTASLHADVRESVSSSILEVDLSLLGIDVSAISGIGSPITLAAIGAGSERDTVYTWEAEESSSEWQDESNTSDGIGLAC